jgi:hypothetical protein
MTELVWTQNQQDKQCTHKHNTEVCSHNNCCCAKAVPCILSVSVALLSQCHVILSPVICQVLTYFSSLSHKRDNFPKNIYEHKECVFIFSANFVWNISQSTKNSARYYHKCTQVFMWSNCYPCQVLIKLIFSQKKKKKYLNIKFHKNSSSENSCSMQTNAWLDRHDKANSHYVQSCECN